ncbi:MAG: sulfite exporter TauE/SafE family protein [Bifidobacteriaceae bacterium]|jgi:uncharacterized membrane protein YfcA|nr:sulfite exporter TauE/SafE family protein [Bifidobacteriaceae bacterium]
MLNPTQPDNGLPAADGAAPLWRFGAIGVAGGFLSGMFGVGGGILMVPLLVIVGGLDQRKSAATSLLAIIPTAAAGAATYGWRGQLSIPMAAIVAAGSVVGSWIGATILRRLRLAVLRWAFIALLGAVAVWMAIYVPVRGAEASMTMTVALGLVALGLAMGVTSALFGVGGGIVAVPALMALFGASDLVARGTSLLIMLPTALTGTVANVRAGLADIKRGTVVGLSATAASLAGSSCAFLLTPRQGNLLFAALLLVSAVQLLLKTHRERRTAPPM